MNDYLNAPITPSTSLGLPLAGREDLAQPNDSGNLYTQKAQRSGQLSQASGTPEVDNTPYVQSDKIIVQKYRLYKTKENS